ncbi:iron-siderophore ABC transporter substrate-binding protein [Paenibacillus sp. N1-5-1-14]|uniref:ABC transporter substrate-binding protein n=1 Tax=Paenibacillus radicibacter TaxID=2972488 RepID=UPI002159717D|nr:iron-siderophore ABC transporter substrate-binding protein [Paenibacillus radicibacter]MCR8645610.1 iron-siderophore ABC transporter substrate-binding protein [Paenibacillus radicibacter]
MKSKSLLMGFMLVAVLMILAGCGKSNQEASGTASPSDKQTEKASKREIKHALGTTTIEGKPKRIVTLFQGATDTLVQFGVKPVGAVESWAQQPVYDYLKNDLKDMKIVGQETQPNLEEIDALKPDLIIATQVRHEKVYAQLSQIAPTVVSTNLSDFKETTTLIGQVLDEEQKATTLLADWKARVTDFNAKMSKTPNWPLSVSIINFRADHARVYLKAFAGSIIHELGFNDPKNLKAEPNADIVKFTDKESIPNMNADASFLLLEDNEAVMKTYKDWSAHPLFKNLDSVKNNQIKRVDEVIWNFGGGLKAANLMLDELYAHFKIAK